VQNANEGGAPPTWTPEQGAFHKAIHSRLWMKQDRQQQPEGRHCGAPPVHRYPVE